MKTSKTTVFTLIGTLLLLIPLLGCQSNSTVVFIHWVDFIKLNDIQYLRNYRDVFVINGDDLTYYDEVKFKVSDNISETGYKIKNGDAAYLEAGTPVYSLEGYSPDYLLVVKNRGQRSTSGEEFMVYQSDTNPEAQTGADLLNIQGRVEYIGINSKTDGKTEIAAIKDEETVNSLVQMVMDAPADQSSDRAGQEQYFIEFHMENGSVINRSYWLDTNVMARGILLPDKFAEAVRAIVPLVPKTDGCDGTEWMLVSLNGNQPVEGFFISLYFREGTAWGYSGINIYNGEYSVDNGTISISSLYFTQLGSPGSFLTDQETAYFKYLAGATTYKLYGSHLEFYDSSGEMTLEYIRLPMHLSNPVDLVGTEWKLVSKDRFAYPDVKEMVPDGLTITLDFIDSGQASGDSGCFHYSVSYQAKNDDINFEVSSERKGTLSPELESNALEYINDIKWAAGYYIIDRGTAHDRLEIYTATGYVLDYEFIGGSYPPPFTKIEVPFTLDNERPGTEIPPGSTIYHWTNFITGVTGPDDILLILVKDTEAIVLPKSPEPRKPFSNAVTHNYMLPDRSVIEHEGEDGRITRVYLDGSLILTIIESEQEYRY